MTLAQTALFDFQPIVRNRPTARRTMLKDAYEDDGKYRIFRTDAKCICATIGTYYDGTALSDTRILENNHHGPIEAHYYRSGDGADQDYPFCSFLQMASVLHKEIGRDGVMDVLDLTEYDNVKHAYNNDYRLVAGAWMDDEVIHIDTEKGDGFDAMIQEDDQCDEYRVEAYDPTINTEHFINEALRRGIPIDDLLWFNRHYAYALTCYYPYSMDWKTGYQQQNDEFVHIGEIADRAGIAVPFRYVVPKPRPERWAILPIHLRKYCNRAKKCNGECIGCRQFIYNRKPVKPEHLDDPTARTSKGGKKNHGSSYDACCDDYFDDEEEGA